MGFDNPRDPILDPHWSVILQAPAGSGKTYHLTRRFVRLLEESIRKDPWKAFQIQAITFTRNAASEMKTRVMKFLYEEVSDLFEEVAWALPFLRITDFHGAYLRIVQRASFLFPQRYPSRDILTSHDTIVILQETLGRFANITDREIHDLFQDLYCQEDGRPQKILDRLEAMRHTRPHTELSQPLAVPPRDPPDPEVLKAVKEELESLKRKRNREAMARKAELQQILKEADRYKVWQEAERLEKGYRIFFHLYNWIYEQVKRERQFLDFADMEREALEILRDPQISFEILDLFDESTNHILIDEFQDTNLLNWWFVWHLMEDWFSGHTRKTERSEPFSFFAVGDPQQSIYIFRGANPEIFHHAERVMKERTQDNPHVSFTVQHLEMNFRSGQRIVEAVNTIFQAAYERLRKQPGAQWITFHPARPYRREKGTVVFYLLTTTAETKVVDVRQQTAALVIREILQYRKRGTPFRDMAILFPQRSFLPHLITALQEAQIPFLQSGGRGFFQTPEIATLLSVVDALINPEGQGARHLSLVAPGWETEIENARSRLRVEPLSRVLADWVREVRYPSHYMDPAAHANIAKFLGLVEVWQERGLSAVEIWQRLRGFAGSREEGQADVVDVDAVHVMTIHAAKGLEFPVVFVTGLEVPAVRDQNLHVILEENLHREEVQVIPYPRSFKEFEPYRRWYSRQLLQSINLLYVAFTRARDHLHVVLPYGSMRSLSQSLSAQIFESLHIDLKQPDSNAFPELIHIQYEGEPHRLPPKSLERVTVLRERVPPFPQDRVLRMEAAGEAAEAFLPSFPHTPSDRTYGDLFHRVLESISVGNITVEEVPLKVRLWLQASRLPRETKEKLWQRVLEDLKRMSQGSHAERFHRWVMPRDDAYAEWPFAMRQHGRIITGRVDRVVVEEDRVIVIDYKTFGVQEKDLPLVKEAFQDILRIYLEAAMRCFQRPQGTAYLWLIPSAQVTPVITLNLST